MSQQRARRQAAPKLLHLPPPRVRLLALYRYSWGVAADLGAVPPAPPTCQGHDNKKKRGTLAMRCPPCYTYLSSCCRSCSRLSGVSGSQYTLQ